MSEQSESELSENEGSNSTSRLNEEESQSWKQRGFERFEGPEWIFNIFMNERIEN